MGTSVPEVYRVRNAILPWIAKGYLGGRRLTSTLMRWRSSGGRGEVFQSEELGHLGENVRLFEADARTISTFPIPQEYDLQVWLHFAHL
jgi:hypothetical protein